MYKSVNKTKAIWRYMEALEIHTGSSTVHLKDNQFFIYVFEAKRVTPRVKHIDVPVCFLQKKIDNDIFVPKYEKSSVMPVYMRNKTCSGTIIIQSTKCMTGFRLSHQ